MKSIITESDYNCGGYALETYDWYLPYGYDEDREDAVNELILEGCSETEIYSILRDRDLSNMLRDFKDRIRIIHNELEALENERIIAYRFFIEFISYGGAVYYDNSDFHYRVKTSTGWVEKNGCAPVSKVKNMSLVSPWIAECGTYDSEIILLAFKN